MTDRPIIFSAPMVRALLAGRKTMTRRLTSSPLARCAAGDRLWVRESFWPSSGVYKPYPGAKAPRARPSIHMPRWASRITLTVTETKIEPLWQISDDDARAEGTVIVDGGLRASEAFSQLWDHIHGDGAWQANPEVVALRFTVALRNIDQATAA